MPNLQGKLLLARIVNLSAIKMCIFYTCADKLDSEHSLCCPSPPSLSFPLPLSLICNLRLVKFVKRSCCNYRAMKTLLDTATKTTLGGEFNLQLLPPLFNLPFCPLPLPYFTLPLLVYLAIDAALWQVP